MSPCIGFISLISKWNSLMVKKFGWPSMQTYYATVTPAGTYMLIITIKRSPFYAETNDNFDEACNKLNTEWGIKFSHQEISTTSDIDALVFKIGAGFTPKFKRVAKMSIHDLVCSTPASDYLTNIGLEAVKLYFDAMYQACLTAAAK